MGGRPGGRLKMARRWTAAWAIMMLIAGMAVAVQVVPLAPASAVSSHPTTIAAGSVS
jgi:MFS superfamily sulfate permease-like transporter